MSVKRVEVRVKEPPPLTLCNESVAEDRRHSADLCPSDVFIFGREMHLSCRNCVFRAKKSAEGCPLLLSQV